MYKLEKNKKIKNIYSTKNKNENKPTNNPQINSVFYSVPSKH